MNDTVRLTCIECPAGCELTAVVDAGRVTYVEGYGCRRGRDYAIAEVECPVRVLTTTVVAEGLFVPVVPVRSSSPVPRGRLMEVMAEIRKTRVDRPICVGDVVLTDVLGLGIDIVATRDVV